MDDLISRRAAIDALGEEPEVWSDDDDYALGLNNQWHYDVNALKAVSPAPSTPTWIHGRWIKMTGMMPPEYFGHYECSECGWHLSHRDKTKETELQFCPHCGARMKEEE